MNVVLKHHRPPILLLLLNLFAFLKTWIGSQVQLQKSNSTTPTGNSFSVAYGSGGAWGDEVFEKVSISSSITVNQSIGIASEAIGFRDVDGILGLGPSQCKSKPEPFSKLQTTDRWNTDAHV